MDTNAITHVSLCSGYGGIDLGLKRAIGRSLRTVAYVEVESFAVANLVAKASQELLDEAPVWSDLRSFPWGKFHGLVDILSGGYPCQPFSAAGKRLGADDPRHLWPHISAGIALMRPAVCFFENVEGHISLGLRDVLQDLVGLGYRATWCVASASECGAPHQRKRVFILAASEGIGLEGWQAWERPATWAHASRGSEEMVTPWPSRPGEQQFAWEPPRVVGQPDELRPQRRNDTGRLQEVGVSRAELAGNGGKSMADASSLHRQWRQPRLGRRIRSAVDATGEYEAEQRQTQPPLGRNADGPADWLDDAELYVTCDNRTDELRLLGNGVVPACAERAFRVLVGELWQLDNAQPS